MIADHDSCIVDRDVDLTCSWENNYSLYSVLPWDIWFYSFSFLSNRDIYRGPLLLNKHLSSIGWACLNKSDNDNFAIKWASERGYFHLVLRMLEDDRLVDPSVKSNCTIRYAALYGSIGAVDHLLGDNRVDPSALSNFALRTAVAFGRTEVVRRLLYDSRVDPSAGHNSALRDACFNGHLEIVKLLLMDRRVDPSFDDNLPIRLASRNGHSEIVHTLLKDERTDLWKQDSQHVVQWATWEGRRACLELLENDHRIRHQNSNDKNDNLQMEGIKQITQSSLA